MAQIQINTGTSANDKTGTNWRVAWQSVNTMLTELYNAIAGIPTKTSDLENDSDFIQDANYVHTDNNYDNDELAAVAYTKPNLIAHSLSVPFTKALTKMATHTMVANIEYTVNSTNAVDTACTQQVLINNSSYTATFTGFVPIGEQDNTKTYTILTFEKIGTIYFVNIANSLT